MSYMFQKRYVICCSCPAPLPLKTIYLGFSEIDITRHVEECLDVVSDTVISYLILVVSLCFVRAVSVVSTREAGIRRPNYS